MIYAYDSESLVWEQFRESFPFDMTSVLSLLSGAQVDMSLICVTDSGGEIVKAFYCEINKVPPSQCLCPFNIGCENYAGDLITAAFSQGRHFKTQIRIALKAMLRSGDHRHSLDDQTMFLSRALEALGEVICPEHKNLATLSEKERDDFSRLMDTTRASLDDLIEDKDARELLASRISGLKGLKNSFVGTVTGLLDACGFPDQVLLADIPKWKQRIASLRNEAAHGGNVSYEKSPHEYLQSMQHMQDIAVRVLLKYFGYAGKYQPQCTRFAAATPVDRLDKDSDHRHLGYC